MSGGIINSQSVTVQSGKLLSDLLGAHFVGDFVLVVENVSPGSPVLNRGSVVCKLASGAVTLAGSEGSGPDSVYGIVLDYQIDPNLPEATVSIARNGVWNAPMLELTPGQDLAAYELPMRERGMFLEKLPHWYDVGNPLPPTP